MRTRTSSPDPAGASAGPGGRPDAGGRLGAELVSALSSARRRAGRDGDRHIDTAHLLHGLVESDPAVRSRLGGPVRVARILGYLAQRSIGYGLPWQRTVESADGGGYAGDPAGTGDATGTRWAGERAALPSSLTASLTGRGGPGWSPAAVAALDAALRRARSRGAARVEGTDLLTALLADPRCRAVEVLHRAGVTTGERASWTAGPTGPACGARTAGDAGRPTAGASCQVRSI